MGGPDHERNSNICWSRNIFLSFCSNNTVESTHIGTHNALRTDLLFLSPVLLDLSITRMPLLASRHICCGSRCLTSWENLVYHSDHWFRPQDPSSLHPESQQLFHGHFLLIDWHSWFTSVSFWQQVTGRRALASSWLTWQPRRCHKEGSFFFETWFHFVAQAGMQHFAGIISESNHIQLDSVSGTTSGS